MITRWADPELLWLLLALVPMVAVYLLRLRRGDAAITISTTRPLEKTPKCIRYWLRHVPFILRYVAVALIIVALARPQSNHSSSNTTTEGIDIVLSLDISSSMLARDFEPDRISAARDVAAKFIADRTNDRLGLVVFASEALTLSPLTTDKPTLLNQLSRATVNLLEDGTAIGNGLATAVSRLKESKAPSKVVILLTDGVNNAGQIAPMTAAEIAAAYGIRVYTIGVGTMGTAAYPMADIWGRVQYVPMPVEIDEQILSDIASITGGEYFRATDTQTLAEVYDRINALETAKIETDRYTIRDELFGRFLLWALAALVFGFLFRSLVLKRIP